MPSRRSARRRSRDFNALFDQFQFSTALEVAWGLVAAVDKYIVENEPWALGEKQDDEQPGAAGHGALHLGRSPAHRDRAGASGDSGFDGAIWTQLGLGDIRKFDLTDLQWGQLHLGTKLGEVQPVFPRADKSAIERMQQMEEQGRGRRRWKRRDRKTRPRQRRCRADRHASQQACRRRDRRWQDQRSTTSRRSSCAWGK